MDEIAYLNAGLVLTLKDERSTSPARAICKSTITADFSEYVDLLCRSKTPLFGGSLKSQSQSKKKNASKVADVDLDPVRGLLTPTALPSCVTETARLTMKPPVTVSVALVVRYVRSRSCRFTNIRTKDGGSHVMEGQSMLDTDDQRPNEPVGAGNLPKFIREGLTAIVSVSVSEPEFEGQRVD
jgi:DNA gyrase subunit B